MKGFWYGLSISLAFIIGCVTAPLIVPPLTAQSAAAGAQRWEYTCVRFRRSPTDAQLNEVGVEGWELVGPMDNDYCFKRPL